MSKYAQYTIYFEEMIKLGQRKGQATFNAVYLVDQEVANDLRAADKDCYYFDELAQDFLDEVFYRWELESC